MHDAALTVAQWTYVLARAGRAGGCFVAGPMEDRGCPANKAQLDDELVAALTEASTWKRQGDVVSFVGSRTLKFRINTN